MNLTLNGLVFLFVGFAVSVVVAETKSKEAKVVSPAQFWQELKKADPTFDPPHEPVVSGKNNYQTQQQKLFTKARQKYEKFELLQTKKIEEILVSPELHKFNGSLLNEVSRLISSSSLQCGYDPQKDLLGQVGQSIIGINNYTNLLFADALSAAALKKKQDFVRRNQQLLSFFQKNLDCSYAMIQLLIAQGGVKKYLKGLSEPSFPQDYRELVKADIEKFQNWYAQNITEGKLRSFYPREAFIFVPVLQDFGTWAKEWSFSQGDNEEGREHNFRHLSDMISIEMEKDYEKIKKDPNATVEMRDFLSVIYYPDAKKTLFTEDIPLFIQTIQAIQKDPVRAEKEGPLFYMTKAMADQLFEDLDLKTLGLKDSSELIRSKALAKLSMRVMEDPTLRFQMRLKFNNSNVATRYILYSSFVQLAQSTNQGAHEKFTRNSEEILKL